MIHMITVVVVVVTIEVVVVVMINNGNRTEWSPMWSVIIRVTNKIGRPRSGRLLCYLRI